VKRSHAFARHQMSAKSRKQKRKLRHSTIVAAVDTPGVKRLLPYL
jgi:ribosomal protein L35